MPYVAENEDKKKKSNNFYLFALILNLNLKKIKNKY